MIDDHFPETNPLSKIINRTSVKISYSCNKNLDRIIKNHNQKLLNKENEAEKQKCNCQKPEKCPLNGECLSESIVYKATISAEQTKTKTYIGMTGDTFKSRYANHKQSFTHEKYGKQTKLAAYIWELKNRNKQPEIKFTKVLHARKFQPGNRNCALCDNEKAEILLQPEKASLNASNEMAAKCPHFRQSTLGTFLYKKEQQKHRDEIT